MHNPEVAVKYDSDFGLAHLTFRDRDSGAIFDRVVDEHEIVVMTEYLKQAKAEIHKTGAQNIQVHFPFDH